MATPVGIDAVTADQLLTRLQQLADSLALPIAMPDVPFDPADHPGGYLIANHLPNGTKWEGLSGGGPMMNEGLITLGLALPKNGGVIAGLNFLAAVKAALPSGTVLYSDGVKVKITRAPWTATPQMGQPFTLYPVLIAWEAC